MIYGGSINGQRKWHSFVLPGICVQKENVILQIQMERSVGEANLDIELFEEQARPHLVLYSIEDPSHENLDDELNVILQNSIHQTIYRKPQVGTKNREEAVAEKKFERMKVDKSENDSIRRKRETRGCALKRMRVNFKEIGWNFMIEPKEFEVIFKFS